MIAFTDAFAKEIVATLCPRESRELEQMSVDLDTHPVFAALTGEERRWFRRLVQQELASRPDSLVSRWRRVGGEVGYNHDFQPVLRGTPGIAELVGAALGLGEPGDFPEPSLDSDRNASRRVPRSLLPLIRG